MMFYRQPILGIIFFDFLMQVQCAWGNIVNVPGEYPTIQKGIDAASAGDRVVVAPGRYNEQIVMKEGIVLQSDSSGNGDELVDGPGRKIVFRRTLRTIIDGTGYPAFTQARPMVEFPAGITRATTLDGFTITKMPPVDHTLPGHAHTLQCRGSSPVIRNNIVVDNGSSGIGSHAQFRVNKRFSPEEKFSFENIGYHSYPLIENNVFAHNIGAGIGNNHYSYATVRNNEVFGSISTHNHPAPGIGIQHGAHPLVEENLVYDNDWTGIGCRRGSLPVNRHTCPVIRGNTVINNGLSGNIIHGAGIGVDGSGSVATPVLIENNIVGNNLAAGIGIRNGVFAVISGNRSYGNDLAGIGMENSIALVKDNIIYNNTRSGIGCRGCQATIENNYTYQNHMAGIGMEGATKMVIVRNRIHDNGNHNFLIHPKRYSNLTGSKFFMITDSSAESFSVEDMVKNNVWENNIGWIYGISYYLSQIGKRTKDLFSTFNEAFIDRIIKRLKQNKPKRDSNYFGVGVGMQKSRVLIFSYNIITNNAQPGLALTGRSSIDKAENNFLMGNGIDNAPNLALLNRSHLNLDETTIKNGNIANIYLSDSYLSLNNCLVERCINQGVIAEKGSVLKIDGGSISENGALGIILQGSQGYIKNAIISGNKRHGIMVKLKSNIRVEKSTINNNSANGGSGICVNQSDARLTQNLIHHNFYVGVDVDDATLVLWNNSLAYQMLGVNIKGKTMLDARNNIFAHNYAEGVRLDKTVHIKNLSHNVFWGNGDSDSGRILDYIFLSFEEGKEQTSKKKENLLKAPANLMVDPGFVDPDVGNYCLEKGSPLIDAGEDLGLPFKGKAPDIGAIEVY